MDWKPENLSSNCILKSIKIITDLYSYSSVTDFQVTLIILIFYTYHLCNFQLFSVGKTSYLL